MSYYHSGWAFKEDGSEQVIEAASKVDYDADIAEFKKTPTYGKTWFNGKLKPGSKVTEEQLLAWADGGNLCFGGKCTIDGLDFTGYYYID